MPAHIDTPGTLPPRPHATRRLLRRHEPRRLIAGPGGAYDWIVIDPDADFAEIDRRFDTLLMGRRTYEFVAAHGDAFGPATRTVVFSRTLRPADHSDQPKVTVVSPGVRSSSFGKTQGGGGA